MVLILFIFVDIFQGRSLLSTNPIACNNIDNINFRLNSMEIQVLIESKF